MVKKKDSQSKKNWTFFSNHGHAIILLHRNPELTVREMAATIGITERALISILSDLQEYGCVNVKKEGRRNIYRISGSVKFRHTIEEDVTLGTLLNLFSK
jgi:predicted transcriptional regulator